MKIDKAVLQSIIDHCRREMPYEACGYLAEENRTITRHYELTNLDKAADHFSMDPGEQFAAIKDMRNRELKLAAVYHSHPETPARPSQEDILLAYDPNTSYVIVSLAEPEAIIKSFRILQGNVTPEDIEIT
jgi:proteasome lid subunit RPN8/RPN11